jgi:uncharacterized protein (TIGR03086 family)
MTDAADRYDRLAARFTQVVVAVSDGAWENPAPCEGWVARDVVRHLVEWVPGFFESSGVVLGGGPSVDEDPTRAWESLDASIRRSLDDPEIAALEFEHGMVGHQTFENAIDQFVTPDVLVHTWDLARATGQDETIDAAECARLVEAMEPMDEVLRQSGHFGPRVAVAADADEQTKLIAFTGRQP